MKSSRRDYRFLLLVPALCCMPPAIADDDEAVAGTEASFGEVHLDAEMQARAGIETSELVAERRQPSYAAIAEVMALDTLLDRRAGVIDARAEEAVAEAERAAAGDTYERLRTLHGDNANISGRELAQARAALRAAQARLEAARARRDNRRAGLEQAWGRALAAAALADDSELFSALRSGRRVLARLTLPGDRHLAEDTDSVYLARTDDRDQARVAELIGPATATGSAGSGETWLVHTAAEGLRAGMRLHAWVPAGSGERRGVQLPASAVVWQAGRPWAYVQHDQRTFIRRPVTSDGGGDAWFVTEGFRPGERLVTRGAQLLLGQELRAQIPEEDDD